MATDNRESVLINKHWLKMVSKRPYLLRLYFSWEAGSIFLFLGCFGFNISYNMMAPQYFGTRMTGYSIFWHPQEILEGQLMNAIDSCYYYSHEKQTIY